jgi:hypothetical protein
MDGFYGRKTGPNGRYRDEPSRLVLVAFALVTGTPLPKNLITGASVAQTA